MYVCMYVCMLYTCMFAYMYEVDNPEIICIINHVISQFPHHYSSIFANTLFGLDEYCRFSSMSDYSTHTEIM